MSERRSLDSLNNVDKAIAVAREIGRLTSGWGMDEPTGAVKIARKIIERQLSAMLWQS